MPANPSTPQRQTPKNSPPSPPVKKTEFDKDRATINLKTSANTTFYKTSEIPATDQHAKRKTYKSRRKKVKSSYHVPAEAEAKMPDFLEWRQETGLTQADKTIKSTLGFEFPSTSEDEEDEVEGVDKFRKKRKSRRSFGFFRDARVAIQKKGVMEEDLGQPPKDPEKRKFWEQEKKYRKKNDKLIKAKPVKRMMKEFKEWIEAQGPDADPAMIEEQMNKFMDVISRQAYAEWEVSTQDQAAEQAKIAKRAMAVANQNYLRELQMYRYGGPQGQAALGGGRDLGPGTPGQRNTGGFWSGPGGKGRRPAASIDGVWVDEDGNPIPDLPQVPPELDVSLDEMSAESVLRARAMGYHVPGFDEKGKPLPNYVPATSGKTLSQLQARGGKRAGAEGGYNMDRDSSPGSPQGQRLPGIYNSMVGPNGMPTPGGQSMRGMPNGMGMSQKGDFGIPGYGGRRQQGITGGAGEGGVIFYDALAMFSEEEQELIRMMINERCYQLKLYNPAADVGGEGEEGGGGGEIDITAVSKLKDEVMLQEMKRKELEEQLKKQAEKMMELITSMTAEKNEIQEELNEKKEKVEQLEEKIAEMLTLHDEEKAALEIDKEMKAEEILMLKDELQELRMRPPPEAVKIELTEEEKAEMIESSERVSLLIKDVEEKTEELERVKSFSELKIGALEVESKKMIKEIEELKKQQGDPQKEAELIAEIEAQKKKVILEREKTHALEQEVKAKEKIIEKRDALIVELKNRITKLELVEQELLTQMAEINANPDVQETGRAFKGMMQKLKVGIPGMRKMNQKVFDRLYNDAMERMERNTRNAMKKLSEQGRQWEMILGQRDLYGEYYLPVERNAASQHLLQAWDSIPDRSAVPEYASEETSYLFAEPVTDAPRARPPHPVIHMSARDQQFFEKGKGGASVHLISQLLRGESNPPEKSKREGSTSLERKKRSNRAESPPAEMTQKDGEATRILIPPPQPTRQRCGSPHAHRNAMSPRDKWRSRSPGNGYSKSPSDDHSQFLNGDSKDRLSPLPVGTNQRKLKSISEKDLRHGQHGNERSVKFVAGDFNRKPFRESSPSTRYYTGVVDLQTAANLVEQQHDREQKKQLRCLRCRHCGHKINGSC